MARTKIADVTDDERNEIRRVYERRTALTELLLTLDSPDLSSSDREALQTSIEEDLARTQDRFEGWWLAVGAKYRLERADHCTWMIDFDTKELWLEPPTGQTCAACRPDGSDRG